MSQKKKKTAPVPAPVPALTPPAPVTAPQPSAWRGRLLFGTVWLGLAAGAYFWGRSTSLPLATAEPAGRASTLENAPGGTGRPIGYIYGTIPVTREQLGDYLIERGGKERSNNLINKLIIEHAARKNGIDVTEAEITGQLNANARELGIDTKDFINSLLKRYGKTLFEWREDVIKPRLMLEKMCRSRVSVTREDLAMAYEAMYGEKVDCRMIMWPHSEKKQVLDHIWPMIRNDEKEFDNAARLQASPSLAATGGHVKPIGRHTTGNPVLEQVIFSLKPGVVSEVIETPEGLVVVKVIGRIPPDTSKSFDQVRTSLEKMVFDKKVALEVGKMFQELRAQAKPVNFLDPRTNVKDSSQQMLEDMRSKDPESDRGIPAGKMVAPAGSSSLPPVGNSSLPPVER